MSLFIGNVNTNITANDLEEVFSKLGNCKIKHFGKYAFAEYEKEEDADNALEKLQGTLVKERKLNLEYSKNSNNL